MKKRKLIISIMAVVMTATLLGSCLAGCSIFRRNDINEFADELFASLFSNDALSANFFFEDADGYLGIKPQMSLSAPSSAEEYAENCDLMYTQATLMAAMFRYSKMSDPDKELFDFLQQFFISQSKFGSHYYLQDSYIGGYSGMQANLPVFLTEYKFRDTQDIEDYISLCEQTTAAFPTWVKYEQARLDNGYGRPQFVLVYAAEQCEGFTGVDILTDDGTPVNPDYSDVNIYPSEANFVLTDAISKLNAAGFLTDAQKSTYASRITTAVNNRLLPAYVKLGNDIMAILANPLNANKFATGGLASYQGGQAYYQAQFSYSTGTSDTITVAYNNSIAAYTAAIAECEALRASLTAKGVTDIESTLSTMFANDDWSETALYGHITDLKQKLTSCGDFPLMSGTGDVTLKVVDKSLSDYYSPASYFVSALDNKNANETIMINNWEDTGYLAYDLLSHEGIGGHLYQNDYLKNSGVHDIVKVLCPTANKEGWATYSEHYFANLYGTPDSVENLLMRYQVKSTEAKGHLRVIADILVNYNGYGSESLATWLTDTAKINDYPYLLPVDGDGNAYAVSVYANSLAINSVMFPCNAATYYYAYLQVDGIIDALVARGYSLYDAHKAFLDSPYTFTQIKAKYGI